MPSIVSIVMPAHRISWFTLMVTYLCRFRPGLWGHVATALGSQTRSASSLQRCACIPCSSAHSLAALVSGWTFVWGQLRTRRGSSLSSAPSSSLVLQTRLMVKAFPCLVNLLRRRIEVGFLLQVRRTKSRNQYHQEESQAGISEILYRPCFDYLVLGTC